MGGISKEESRARNQVESLAAKPLFNTFHTLDTQNEQSAILGRLGASEQHEPQRSTQSRTHGQGQCRKRKDVEQNARREHNNARAKRQSRKPMFYSLEYIFQQILHYLYFTN